jgi:hypothetical protein
MHRSATVLVSSVLAAAAGLSFAASAHAAAPEKHSKFVPVLMKNFDAWDTDKDGTLSAAEIDKAVLDPAVKGDDAAAAATLELLWRSAKKLHIPPLTKAYFAAYDAKASGVAVEQNAEQQTTDTVASSSANPAHSDKGPNWDLYFAASRKRIAAAEPAAFTGHFALDKMHQGPVGDCFLVAAIGSTVGHRPAALDSLIKATDDGYEVTFPGAAPFKMPRLTDAEFALSGSSFGKDAGAWLPVVEQAYGRLCSIRKGQSSDIEGTDIITKGGDSTQTIAALTGHDAKRIHFGRTVQDRAAHANTILPELRTALVEAIKDHRVITGGVDPHPLTESAAGTQAAPVGDLPAIPPAISIHHVYAIVDYDSKTDVVTIWNPHGNTFKPKGPDGLENGYTTEKGIFHLPLKEAFAFYSSFTFETDEAVKVAKE